MTSYCTSEKDILNLSIIAYVKARQCIWNYDVRYGNSERDEAWKSFSEAFSLPVPELRKRWEGMRQMYCEHLKEYITTGAYPKWSCFSKLDEFLNTPTRCLWQKEGTMPKRRATSRSEDIEYIDLSSDSDGESNRHESKRAQVDSSEKNVEKPSEKAVKLKTADDVRNELRKIPPVSGSSGVRRKEPISSGMPHQSNSSGVSRRPSLGPNKKRKSFPTIPDAKKRLIRNCGELYAIPKPDPNDAFSRSLPHRNSSSISSPPHKMFGSPSANVVPNFKPSSSSGKNGKSFLKKMKRKLEKVEGKQFKNRSPRPPATPSTGTSGPVAPSNLASSIPGNDVSLMSSSDAKKLPLSSETSKIPPGTAFTLVQSGSDIPKVTVRLTPSSEGVTLHSVPATSKEESRLSTQDKQQDQSRVLKKSKKKVKERNEDRKRQIINEQNEVTSDLIELDNSDTEATSIEPNQLKKSTKEPDVLCLQNGLDHFKPDNQKPGEDIWKKWEAEATELRTTEDEPVGEEDEEGDRETVREVRKNFLLSLLPDMAEMTMEQRRFFKSKLMYLVCNIDRFS